MAQLSTPTEIRALVALREDFRRYQNNADADVSPLQSYWEERARGVLYAIDEILADLLPSSTVEERRKAMGL